MKERPILFSGDMVRKLLAGMKTQTRRVVKPQPEGTGEDGGIIWKGEERNDWELEDACPYGRPGDRLWVRETFFDVHRYKSAPLFVAVEPDFIYRADYEYREPGRSVIGCHRWRPSIFCPRNASRIMLEITSVRVERLQAITLKDICNEGLAKNIYDFKPVTAGLAAWIDLWDSINKKPHTTWYHNPWVWVVEFKRVLP